MTRSVSIATLGCKVNHYESAGLKEALAGHDFNIVPFGSPADIIIIDTCTVTAKSDFQSRQLIRRARRSNHSARIIVTGCYAQVAPSQLAKMCEIDLIVGTTAKDMIPDLIEHERYIDQRIIVPDTTITTQCSCPSVVAYQERSRAFLKVQDGCDAYCSYCIVPHARGRSRSVPPDDVLARVRGLTDAGFHEVVLTGIHLGAYGQDLNSGDDLVRLLRRIEKETNLQRLRLSSIEPTELTDDFISCMSNSAILCRHVHIPLQSGDTNVLRAMNRHYTAETFRERIESLIGSIPDIGIGIDVMAGFPGESPRAFEATVTLLETLPAAYLHVFPYSQRPGTAASTLPGQGNDSVKRARTSHLRKLGEAKRLAFSERAVGTTVSVLLEDRRDVTTGSMKGFTGNYLPIVVENASRDMKRQLIYVQVTESRDGRTFGRIVHD